MYGFIFLIENSVEERQVLNKYGTYLYKSCAQATENDNQKEKRTEKKAWT